MAVVVNYEDLLRHCVDVLESFDADRASVDTHTAEYLKSHRCLGCDESSATFVREVFSGCVQFRKVTKVVTDNFYLKQGKNFKRTDVNLLRVFAYLALFRLEELGIEHFKKFVNTQLPQKMHKFLSFLFDETSLKSWLATEWCKVYDEKFIQANLVFPLLRWHSEMQQVLRQLKDKLDNVKKPRQVQAATEPKPFNLTKPRPRTLPLPEKIPKLKPHRPVPASTYTAPFEMDSLAKTKEYNKKKAAELLDKMAKSSPACAAAGKSEKTLRLMEKIKEEKDAKLDFNSAKALPVPPAISDNVPIKLNTAAILREGALFHRREKEEKQKLAELIAGGKDASEFLQWQEENRRKELEDDMAEIERRHLIGQLSHEDAILARRQLDVENRQKVLKMKEESSQLMQLYLQRRLEEEQGMRKLVEEVMNGHQNAKESVAKMRDIKQKIVREVSKESQELLKRALEEAEEEMKRKVELIGLIKAFESKPIIRTQFVDLTSTAGQGLLCEMSIAELRERLAWLKSAEEEEEETRREEIVAGKRAKERRIISTLGSIARHRAEQSRASAVKQEQLKRESQTRLEVVSSKVLGLQRRLEAKRAERQRIMTELQTPPKTNSTRKSASAKRQAEERRWKDVEITREKSAASRARGLGNSRRPRETSELAS